MRLPPDGEEAKRIAARARTGQAAIESIEAQTQRMPPPALYDLTELQRHANRLFGFSAQKTLDTAQALYERHKLISYPRTDSRHLSQDVARTLPRVVDSHRGALPRAPCAGHRRAAAGPPLRGRCQGHRSPRHHSHRPRRAERASLSPEERKIYDLICRRLLSAWHDDHIWSVTTVITAIRNDAIVDRYHTSGSAVQQVGWKVLDLAPREGEEGRAGRRPMRRPNRSCRRDSPKASRRTCWTWRLEEEDARPQALTEGTLLTAMETAGKTLDEKELSDAMKETGLGTPATRASIIEVLLKREYIVRNGKSLEATDKGIRLIEVVHPEVKSPAMTGQWEAYLHRIQRGTRPTGPFIKGIEEYVREVVGKVGQVVTTPRSPQREGACATAGQSSARRAPLPRQACARRRPRTPHSPSCCKPPSASPPSAPARKPSARP